MRQAMVPWFALGFCLLAGCATERPSGPPTLGSLEEASVRGRCRSVFPSPPWQFAHAIEFALADGGGGTAIGVTTCAAGEVACALLTVEGLTLFEARQRQGETVTVLRALPPFDKAGFAEGMMDDIRAIFFPPEAERLEYGHVEAVAVCRHLASQGRVTDVLPALGGCWRIMTFRQGQGERIITGTGCAGDGISHIPEFLELRKLGLNGYTLRLTLLRAEYPENSGVPHTR